MYCSLLWVHVASARARARCYNMGARRVVDLGGRQTSLVRSDSQCCLPACLRPPGSPFPMAASLRCPPCSTRLVDHTGLGRAGPGPHHCRSLSRAAGWGLLLLHGAETVSPGDELTAAWLFTSSRM